MSLIDMGFTMGSNNCNDLKICEPFPTDSNESGSRLMGAMCTKGWYHITVGEHNFWVRRGHKTDIRKHESYDPKYAADLARDLALAEAEINKKIN
jgi:hypothetical protein